MTMLEYRWHQNQLDGVVKSGQIYLRIGAYVRNVGHIVHVGQEQRT